MTYSSIRYIKVRCQHFCLGMKRVMNIFSETFIMFFGFGLILAMVVAGFLVYLGIAALIKWICNG